jgi:hypothetical protein
MRRPATTGATTGHRDERAQLALRCPRRIRLVALAACGHPAPAFLLLVLVHAGAQPTMAAPDEPAQQITVAASLGASLEQGRVCWNRSTQ